MSYALAERVWVLGRELPISLGTCHGRTMIWPLLRIVVCAQCWYKANHLYVILHLLITLDQVFLGHALAQLGTGVVPSYMRTSIAKESV